MPLTVWVGFVLLRGDFGFFDSLSALSPWNWAIMLSMGLTGVVGHLLQAQAYRLAAASLLAPFMYLQIIAASALGWLVWGEFPDRLSWFGIGLICASGAGIACYEWYQSRPKRQAA
jgi:drug/metabolite transporter (DMT)-like permease